MIPKEAHPPMGVTPHPPRLNNVASFDLPHTFAILPCARQSGEKEGEKWLGAG